jgi:hypothetical protein
MYSSHLPDKASIGSTPSTSHIMAAVAAAHAAAYAVYEPPLKKQKLSAPVWKNHNQNNIDLFSTTYSPLANTYSTDWSLDTSIPSSTPPGSPFLRSLDSVEENSDLLDLSGKIISRNFSTPTHLSTVSGFFGEPIHSDLPDLSGQIISRNFSPPTHASTFSDFFRDNGSSSIAVKLNCQPEFSTTTFNISQENISEFDASPPSLTLQTPSMPPADTSTTQSKPKDKEVFREYNVFPPELTNPLRTGTLNAALILGVDVYNKVSSLANLKMTGVSNGTIKFGQGVCIESFKPSTAPHRMACTLPNLFLLHTLCKPDVMETLHGKVSVYPVTVFTSEQQKVSGKGGYPVLAIHKAHIKCVMNRLFSVCKKLIENKTISENLCEVFCTFDEMQDGPLVTISGLEPFNHKYQKQQSGFFLLSAGWFDVMKNLFLDTDTLRVHDIGDVFRSAYAHMPTIKDKFQEDFRCIWLGDERQANVMDMVKSPTKDHTRGMARCRAADGKVRIGKNGLLWKLPGFGEKGKLAKYDSSSLVYGVSCWKGGQLESLNDAYRFFTNLSMPPNHPVCHQNGLFDIDLESTVMDRETAVSKGIYNDSKSDSVSPAIRSQRYKIKRKFGNDFIINYWGHKKTCFSKKNAK